MRQLSAKPGVRAVVLATWLLAILGAAGWLRFAELERMPFHADEAATGAQSLAYRLEASYDFDPRHFHGPMLTALAEPWCRLKGETDWESLREVTLRQLVAGCGLLTVLGVLLLGMGWVRAAVAMGLAATSPLLVYYSRVFIHEPVFLFFAMPAVAGLLWLLRGRRPWLAAIALGLGIGGMAATRETVVVSLFAWALAGACFSWRGREESSVREFLGGTVSGLWGPVALAAGLCLAVIFWFYSSGGQSPAGFFGFFTTYFEYEIGEGHEKPLDYFIRLLLWPKHALGSWWWELGVFLLALGVWFDRKGDEGSRAGRFFFEAGLLHLLAFSLIGYKTPWLVCLGWLHFAIAGGYGVAALASCCPRWSRPVAVVAVVLITGWQGLQAKRAVFRFASDGRNPYAYVPTSADATRLPAFLEEVREALPEAKEEPLAVVGEQYWPLPWYLRGAGTVGYWEAMPEEVTRLPVLLLLPSAVEEAGRVLGETHTMIPRGLRDEFPVMVAVRKDVWEAYQAK